MDALRQHLQPVIAGQTEHPVYARYAVDWEQAYDMGSLAVRVGGREVRMSAGQLDEAMAAREQMIREERVDPYRHGFEPGIWRETDWRLAELRLANPGDPIILGVLGGNGGGKSYYCGKRFDMVMVENEDWLCWQLSLDEDSSREVPQRICYEHLPQELQSEKGKLKKTAQTKLSYNRVNGFTDNSFGLENGSRCNFKFYGGGDVNSLEGPRPDMVWADEMVPVDWVRAAMRRLMTKAEKSKALHDRLAAAVAVRREIIGRLMHDPAAMQSALTEAWHVHLRPILAKLFQGVCMISFTPKNGYTRTVAMLTAESRVLEEVEAELLPILRDGVVTGYEKVPRVMLNENERSMVIFFHIYDNPFGGNWEAQKRDLAKRSRDEKLWRAYGVATRIAGVQMPMFKREAHVRSVTMLPKAGTWYHIVDPCSDGRNWFMIWAKVCPNVLGKPSIWVAREWPQPDDFIVAGNVGNPGMWAVLEDSGNADGRKKAAASKMDGERGPAQRNWGMGFRQYAEEIERVERELGKLEGVERITLLDGCRIMDSRAANTETQTHGEALTLIATMEEYDLQFCAAGRDSGAEAGSTTIREGVMMINDRLNYDAEQVTLTEHGIYRFDGHAPSLYVLDGCRNLIFCCANWTGMDGGKGAMKDPVDVLRYLIIAGPEHVEARKRGWHGGGGF
jgi:hypothetical protein